jgi:hypothetical protein
VIRDSGRQWVGPSWLDEHHIAETEIEALVATSALIRHPKFTDNVGLPEVFGATPPEVARFAQEPVPEAPQPPLPSLDPPVDDTVCAIVRRAFDLGLPPVHCALLILRAHPIGAFRRSRR